MKYLSDLVLLMLIAHIWSKIFFILPVPVNNDIGSVNSRFAYSYPPWWSISGFNHLMELKSLGILNDQSLV